MATLQDILGAYGASVTGLQKPGQQFYQFASGIAPGPSRQAFWKQEDPLTARFQLRQPEYGGQFANWLGAYGNEAGTLVPGYNYPATTATNIGVTPLTGAEIRGRATGIAGLTGMTGTQYLDYLGSPNMGSAAYGLGTPQYAAMQDLTPTELGEYRTTYGTGADAGTNVQDLIKLMAMQRPEAMGGERQYGGATGQALSSLVDELFTAYIGQNPELGAGSFLQWWLDASKPGVAAGAGKPAVAPGRLAFGG
jgi:hypothetical protein